MHVLGLVLNTFPDEKPIWPEKDLHVVFPLLPISQLSLIAKKGVAVNF
jgi:hypothetical protein